MAMLRNLSRVKPMCDNDLLCTMKPKYVYDLRSEAKSYLIILHNLRLSTVKPKVLVEKGVGLAYA